VASFYHQQPSFLLWLRNDAFHLRIFINHPRNDPNHSGMSTLTSIAPPYPSQEASRASLVAPEVVPVWAPSAPPAVSHGPLVAPSDSSSDSLYIPEYFFPVNGGTSQDEDMSQSQVDEEEWNQAYGDPDEESSQGGSIPGSVLAEVFAEHLELRWESIGFERMLGFDSGEVSRELDGMLERGGPVSLVVYDGDNERM
jgi:hypothetical protein